MKKNLRLIFFLAAAGLCAQTEGLPFSPGEFDVDIYQYPYMALIDNPPPGELDTVYAFAGGEKTFEIRYGFFTQTQKDYADIKRAFALCIIPVAFNAAGGEFDLSEIELFDDADVKEEFNGDMGATAFIQNPESGFGAGYAYMLINFFYKRNQGIVVQTILFNDIEFAGTDQFAEVLHSFKFHE
jgi:hypothetical protein